MATTVGRVEFIVGLDGRQVKKQADDIARKIAAAGTKSGDDFGDNFEASSDRRLSTIGDRWSKKLSQSGNLAGERFSETFNRQLTSRFSKMQNDLAAILSDKDMFADYAKGFDSIDDAVKQVNADLGKLQEQNREWIDDNGKLQKQIFITKNEVRDFGVEARRLGEETKKTAEAQAELERMSKNLDDTLARTLRTIGDTDAFERASRAAGGTAIKYRDLRDEIEAAHDANLISTQQMEMARDTLDRTRESVIKKANTERDAAIAADDLRRHTAALDNVMANLDKTMGDQRVFNERAKALGGVSAATAEATRSIRELENLGGSQESIQKLTRRLEGLRLEFDTQKDRPGIFSNLMKKAAQKVGQSWKQMDGTVKLVLAAILSAGDAVAVLGSAAGAGIIALGGALTSLVAGALAGVAVFANLNQEIEDAPVAMRPAIASFNSFKKALGGVNDEIALAAFDEMQGAFIDIGKSVKALEPSLTKLGASLGRLVREFAQNVRPGTEAFEEMDEAILNAVPNVTSLSRTVGTLGVALLRAFNGAQPLVEQLTGWLGRLTQSFDTFTRDSEALSTWVSNAQRIFHSLGGTLDALGTALNELSNPKSFDRTVQFLDDLTRFVPDLGKLLEIFGSLNLIGTAASLLANFGEAMRPLAGPTKALAEALGEVLMAVSEATPAFAVLAKATAPLVAALAGIIAAVPPSVWTALATAASLYAVALGGLKIATLASGWVNTLAESLVRATMGHATMKSALAGTVASMKKFAGSAQGMAAGLAIIAAGSIAAVEATEKWRRELHNIDATVRRAVDSNESLVATANTLSGAQGDVALSTENLGKALDGLEGWNGGNFFERMRLGFIGVGPLAESLTTALGELDTAMQGLPLEDQAKKFKAWADETEATEAQVLAMLDATPKYKRALEEAAAATGKVAVGSDLAALALSGMVGDVGGSVDALDDMTTASGKTIRSIDDLADAIRGFGDTSLNARDAARNYESAIDDLTASVAENGTTLDITTEAGRNNEKALDDIAEAALENSASIKENTGSQELATEALNLGRKELIKQLEQFGITGAAADAYADQLGLVADGEGEAANQGAVNRASLQNTLEQFGLTKDEAANYIAKLDEVPGDVESVIEILNVDPSIQDINDVKWAMDQVKNKTVFLKVITEKFTYQNAPGAGSGVNLPGGASGGTFSQATNMTIGEAGKELLVPVNRPLSLVDPSVRALSAVLQGKSSDMARAGIPMQGSAATASKVVNISPGAIVVQGSLAPEATATNVVNRIAERVGS